MFVLLALGLPVVLICDLLLVAGYWITGGVWFNYVGWWFEDY